VIRMLHATVRQQAKVTVTSHQCCTHEPDQSLSCGMIGALPGLGSYWGPNMRRRAKRQVWQTPSKDI
jgi:hypothetical protein